MRPHHGSKVGTVYSRNVFFVGVEPDAARFEKRDFRREASGSFVLGSELARLDFAGLDVRLIERVDSDNRTGHGSGDFPAKKFLPEIVDIWQRNAHDWMSRFLSASTAASWALLGFDASRS